ncbi:hypothetical protein F4212_12400 [Candidatus Poribacteria bacterium]|nr:hypothetical protein [Candidatus Poribacteria bacterium]
MNPSQDSIEVVDEIINFNRGLWGGRFNPIILTDGNTIEDNWWKFLRDVDPDVIKSFVPLGTELIENFEQFLSPLQIEDYKEDKQSGLGTYVDRRILPAGIDMNSLIFANLRGWYGIPTIAAFDLNEMDDDIGKNFVIRNFGTYERTNSTHIGRNFTIPISYEDVISRGKVPQEIHDGFKQNNIPFSNEVICKDSIQRPGEWVLIDKEKNQRHFVKKMNGKLLILPDTQNFSKEFDEVEKEVFLITDRDSLSDVLLGLARSEKIVYQDQICAFPNSERELERTWLNTFEIIVGDTLQDIVHFWNRPWLISRWKRKYIYQLLIPTDLAADSCMEDALCALINKYSWSERQHSRAVQFVSFSIKESELESIAGRFRKKISVFTNVKCYEEPQVADYCPEYPLFSFQENPLSSRDNSIEIYRGQSSTNIIELTEPNGLAQRDHDGHWMADFYIEFAHDRYANREDVRIRTGENSFLWQFPSRNHLTYSLFNRSSRIKLNGFPSARIKKGEKVLRLTLTESELVVKSLFFKNNRHVYVDSDPRAKVATAPYYSARVSDKGKYLQGVLELFGNLTFAYEVLRNPYWRTMFDNLSKNTNAEQAAQISVANKIQKLIDRSGPLTSGDKNAIESLATLAVNLAKDQTIKQKESPLKAFTAEAEKWRDKYIEGMKSTSNFSENDLIGLRFSLEDINNSLSQLTEKNIIQIGVRPQCLNCGMTDWYHVDDIGQHLICRGCRMPFPLQPELVWQYRLNNLVHAAHAQHGTTPLILVLGQLLDKSRDSFLYSPNLNLYAEPQDRSIEAYLNDLDLIAEVDIACIQDGKFIIGEVKQSMRLFSKKDFDDMAKIAKRVKPDIVLFSCIDKQQPTQNITDHIERIKKELCSLEIDVEWYELEALDYSYSV